MLQGTRRLRRKWCGRGDSNPHRHCCPTDFRTSYGFRRLAAPGGEASSWSGLSLHRAPAPEFRCCPSSLYTFPAVSGRAWLGIAMLQGSPNLSSSAPPVSRRALKFSLKSVASADSATPAWMNSSQFSQSVTPPQVVDSVRMSRRCHRLSNPARRRPNSLPFQAFLSSSPSCAGR